MSDEQLYEDWKHRRRRQAVPEGFSDRVLAAVAREQVARRAWSFPAALLSSRAGQVAACTLAAGCCLFRLMHVVAIFVPR